MKRVANSHQPSLIEAVPQHGGSWSLWTSADNRVNVVCGTEFICDCGYGEEARVNAHKIIESVNARSGGTEQPHAEGIEK